MLSMMATRWRCTVAYISFAAGLDKQQFWVLITDIFVQMCFLYLSKLIKNPCESSTYCFDSGEIRRQAKRCLFWSRDHPLSHRFCAALEFQDGDRDQDGTSLGIRVGISDDLKGVTVGNVRLVPDFSERPTNVL